MLFRSVGHDLEEGNVPAVEAEKGRKTFASVEEAIKRKTVLACHDISEGGLAVALAEMCFAGSIGADVELQNIPHSKPFFEKAQIESARLGPVAAATWGLSKNGDEIALFSESQTRFIVEVAYEKESEFETIMKKQACPYGKIGKTKGKKLLITGNGRIIDADIHELKEAWQKPLRW